MGKLLAVLVAICVGWWWFVARHRDSGPEVEFHDAVVQAPKPPAGESAPPPGVTLEIRDQDGNPVDLASLPPEVREQILKQAGTPIPAGSAPPGAAAKPAGPPAKEFNYRDRDAEFQSANVSGWIVILERQLSEANRPLANRVLTALEKQLDAIAAAVPPGVAIELRQVPIWIDYRSKSPRGGQYHWSAEGARQAGEDPRKAGGVEITRAEDFLEMSEWEQPWMVLHELAHAWHHRVLGEGSGMVRNAYENAKRSGSYESVKHVGGVMMQHYAMTNDREYFAELSEAYFGRNDFFPFQREELKKHDPMGYAMIETAWRLR